MPNSFTSIQGASDTWPVHLIIAATAELNGLTVLHLDRDFEVIGQVTGQSVEQLSMEQ